MKKILLLAILLLATHLVCAQTVDSVTLKDGSVITGAIKQYEPGKYVIIDLPDGTQKMYNWDVISSVEKKSEAEPEPAQPIVYPGDIKANINQGIRLQYDQTLPSDKLRLYWQQQGGNRFYSDMTMNYIGIQMQMDTTGTKLDGNGFGFTGSASWLYFSPPNYATKKYHSIATKLGLAYGLNANFFSMSSHSDLGDYYMDMESDIATVNIDLGAAVGANIGLGAFPLSQKWYGAILGITWRPVFRLTTNSTTTTITSDIPYVSGVSTDSSDDSVFDTGAIEYSLDFGGIKALSDKFAPRSAMKINFIYVPPVGKYKMTMWMLGIGFGRYQ